MGRLGRLYARTSVLYLVLAGFAGAYLFVRQNSPTEYIAAHGHLLLVGWMTLGLAAMLLGRGQAPPTVAVAGWGLTNIGLIAMTAVWVASVEITDARWLRLAMAGSAALEVLGFALIAVSIWVAAGAPRPKRAAPPAPEVAKKQAAQVATGKGPRAEAPRRSRSGSRQGSRSAK